MSKHKIPITSIISDEPLKKISAWAEKKIEITDLVGFLLSEFQIDCTTDQEIIQGFDRDSSNIEGKAEALSRPVIENE